MSKVNSFLTLFAASVIVGVPAYSQEDYRSEVTVQGMGSFTKETTQSGIKQDAYQYRRHSGGVSLLLHQAHRRGNQLRLHAEHPEVLPVVGHDRHQELLA